MTNNQLPNRKVNEPTQPSLKRSRDVLEGNTPPSTLQTEPPTIVPSPAPKEFGGPEGPEPTRYGDWEKKGRCIDF